MSIPVRLARLPILSAHFGMLLLVAGLSACGGKKTPPPPPPVEVSFIEIVPREATVTIDYVAQTEALNTVEIRPRVGGLLEKQAAQEGSRVKAGQVLFELDRQPYAQSLEQARAALAQARAGQEQAKRDLARVQPLAELDAVSKQEVDAAVARNDANGASVQAAQAQVRTAELNLGYATVTSPIDGVMGRVQLKVGGLVTAYTTLLATVYSTDPMYVNFSISEQRLLELQRQLGHAPDQNMSAPPAFKLVLADGSEYPEPGKLNFVDAAVDQHTGTLAVRLTVPNPRGELRAGQFARVVVAAQKLSDALLVPQRAVLDLQGKNFLWLVGAENKAEQRDVTMGARVGENWIVAQGLKAGDHVIVDGVQKMRPGMVVNAQPLVEKAGAEGAKKDAAPAPVAEPEGSDKAGTPK